MATLQTIRNRGGLLVSIVIGLALIAFIVGDALNSGSRIFNSQRNQIGEIAGEGVSIIDFQNRVSKNEEMIKAMNNVSSLNEEQQTMLRENTWQQMIMEQLMQREYDEIGIDVSGDELYDALLGENMSPALRQLFTNPNTGEIDYAGARDYVKKVISAPNNIPQKAYWLNMEKEVSDSRKMAKYNAIVAKALYNTDAQAQEAAANSADKADISYIVKNYSTIEDSTINVSNGEIKEYYNKHQKSFEQPESRKIVYVNFDIEPSGEDFSETEGAVNDLVKEFEESADPLEFVNLSSEQKADRNYFKQDEIANDSMAQFLFNNEKAVFGPYLENNAYKISRVASVKMLPDSVRARHILIAPQNQDYAQAKNIADSLAGLLRKGADFEELAKTNSVDQNSAVNGGDLGWFTSRTMVQPFSDSAFFAKKNDIKVVLTQYGAHVLQVTDMAKPVKKIQIATVEKEVSPSAKTTNQIYNDARTFAIEVSNLDNFNKKVEESGLTKRIATIGKNDKTIAGMESAREMIRQAYMAEEVDEVLQERLDAIQQGVWAVGPEGECIDLKLPSVFMLEKSGTDLLQYGHRIFIAGAVSDKVFQFLRVQKQTVELIVRDFTRVFAAPESFYAFLRKGGRVQVLHRSRLLAVTINPQSPGGLLLDSLRLQQALEESLQIPVYDVKKIEKVGKNR